MPFTLDQILPWGRSFDEYVGMFGLTAADLDNHPNILGQVLKDGPRMPQDGSGLKTIKRGDLNCIPN